jgi:hypothetical protein
MDAHIYKDTDWSVVAITIVQVATFIFLTWAVFK